MPAATVIAPLVVNKAFLIPSPAVTMLLALISVGEPATPSNLPSIDVPPMY